MPIYEFQCQDCGNIMERIMKMSDPNPTQCDACGGNSLVKLMSRTNFVLKGQGWYETDFKDKKTTPSDKNGQQSPAKPSKSSAPAKTSGSEKDGNTASGSSAAKTKSSESSVT